MNGQWFENCVLIITVLLLWACLVAMALFGLAWAFMHIFMSVVEAMGTAWPAI